MKATKDQLEQALVHERDRSDRVKSALEQIGRDLDAIDLEGRENLVASMKREVEDAIRTYEDLKNRFGMPL